MITSFKSLGQEGGGGGGVSSYNELTDKPKLNNITIRGSLSLQDINVYSIDEVNDLLDDKANAKFVNQLPASPTKNTWYYSKKFQDGTDVPNDKRALYIVLEDVLVYNYMGVVGDIDLTDYYTKNEVDNKVSLVYNKVFDLTTTNFRNGVLLTRISDAASNSTIPTGSAVRSALAAKQDTLIASDIYTAPSDTDKLSYVSGVTNNRWTFAKIWDWIVSKLTANTNKGIQVDDNGNLGHTNLIVPPSNSSRFICGALDDQGHFTGTPVAFQYSDVYNSTLDNCLFTRKGANNLYNWAKITDASGGNAVTTTGMDIALTRTSGSHQSTVSRVMKYGGVVSLQYFGQYSSSSAISGKFTCIGSVPADYKPVSQVAIQVTTWNANPQGCASGYVTSDGKIYVWVSSIGSGQTNIQFVINATWKGA